MGILLDELGRDAELERERYRIKTETMMLAFLADGTLDLQEKARLEAEEQAHQDRLQAIRVAGLAKIRAAKAEETKTHLDAAKLIGASAQAVANTLVSFAQRAAEGQKLTARDLAKELVKTVGEQAAAIIMAHAATGAAAEFAKGLVGVPAGLAILAKGAALAAGVAALTGVAVRAIGGGGGGGGETPSGGGGGVETPTATQPVVGAPPGQNTPGMNVVINVSGADILQADQVARAIRDAIAAVNST
jgi:hypothetical protein